jgi:hypothetical protein
MEETMIGTKYGEIFHYPLRTQPKQKWSDKGFTGLPGDTVMMTTLIFRIRGPRPRPFAGPLDQGELRMDPIIEWECMACAEAGNYWAGVDPAPHAEAHQMGFDYAMTWLEKQKKK